MVIVYDYLELVEHSADFKRALMSSWQRLSMSQNRSWPKTETYAPDLVISYLHQLPSCG